MPQLKITKVVLTLGIIWSYCRAEPALNDINVITDLDANYATTGSFKIKEKMTGQTGNNGTKEVEVMVPLKYLSNSWNAFN